MTLFMIPVLRKAAITFVVVALLIVSVSYLTLSSREHILRADFDRTTGLYTGSEVRVMGVKIGTVKDIKTRGDRVRVTMSVDGRRKLPADVKAAIVAPSLVSGRYVQLAPVLTSGPTLADGDLIPIERTAVPVEWDDIKEQLTRVTSALGPTEGLESGPLSDFITSAASVFDGNGSQVRTTLAAMSDAASTLSGNSDNLFVTIRSLADFIDAMNASSRQVKTFSTSLRSISQVLEENRGEMADLLSTLDGSMQRVTSFVNDNRVALDTGVEGLRSVSDQLADQQVALANILHLAPTTVANFYNIYDPTAGTLTGRLAAGQTNGFANFVCQSVYSAGGTLDDCKSALGPLLDLLNQDPLPVSVNPLTQPGADNQVTPPGAPSAPAAAGTQAPADAAGAGQPTERLSRLLLGGLS